MSSINKFYPINIQNANTITGTYQNVSLLVNADEEVKGNLFTKNAMINTTYDGSYSLAVVGDVSFSGNLFVGGQQITPGGGGGGSQDLSGVLSYNNNAGAYDINMNFNRLLDVSGITGAQIDISGNTVFNNSYLPGRLENVNTATAATFNITFPMRHFYNFFGNGTTVVNLPNITTLKANQQTQLCFTKNTGAVLNIYPDPSNTLRLPNGTAVANYLWDTPTSMLIIQCSVVGGITWRITYIENPVDDTLGDVMNRGNQASTYLDMNFNPIDNISAVSCVDVTSTNLITSNQLYTENFYYSNISADIAITNWDASIPNYSPTNGLYLQYSGTATYSGTSGIVTSGSGTYAFQIVRGLFQAAYYLTYWPPGVTSQQAFTMQSSVNNTFTFKTINYSLLPGQYIWGCWYQNQQSSSATLTTYIKTSAGVVLASEAGVFPGNDYPNWIFKTLPFTITSPTDIYFEATSVAKSFASSVVMTGLELTQTGAMVVTDTVTNKTATISGTQSFLNSLYVNSGLQVDSGGLDVVGGLSTSTAYGSSNISINSPYGSTTKANNSGDIISIGAAVNQDMSSNALGNYRVVAIGNGANTGALYLLDAVSVGYNSRCTTNAIFSVAVGSRCQAKGAYTVAVSPDALANSNGGCIGPSNVVVGFGACGSSVYNGFGSLSSTENVYVGTRAGYSAADNRNTGIGYQALWNINGRNGVTANGNSGKITQQNTALGYNSGALRSGYNNCTFLGAGADASVENLVNATAIGYNAQVDVSNAIVLGSAGTNTKVMGDLYGITTINGAAYPPAAAFSLASVLSVGNKANMNIDMSSNSIINVNNIQVSTINGLPPAGSPNLNQVLTAGNTASTNIIMNGVGIRNAYKNIPLTASASYASTWGDYLGNYTTVQQSAAFTLTIGNPADYSGGQCQIENISTFPLTITSTGNFVGQYGNNATTYVIYPGQTAVMFCTSTNWWITAIRGMPPSYRRIGNAAQTLATAGTSYTALFALDDLSGIDISTGVNTWSGTKLSYAAGVFTNNTGYPMKIQVDTCIYFAVNNIVRFTGYRLLNATRNPYNRFGFMTSPTNSTLNPVLSFQLTLANGDSFDIFLQTQGTNVTTSSGTVQVNMNCITITRIG